MLKFQIRTFLYIIMSLHKNNKIKVSRDPTNKTEINALRAKMANGNALLSFRYFNPKSIKVGDFNNYYANRNSALKAVIEFVVALKNLSQINHREVFSNQYLKSIRVKQIRNDDKAVARIEKVLAEGYNFPPMLIDQFERSYIEIAFGDGHRAISICVDGIIEVLFIDNNHLICRESSRENRLKLKESFGFPCLLDSIHIKNDNHKECNVAELVIQEMENDKHMKAADAIKLYYELMGYEDE
mgnify:CR=1 FL=1